MIYVEWGKKDDTCVTICVDTSLNVEKYVLIFKWETKEPIFAQLLQHHLRDKIEKMMERIREANYKKGYRDAKAKRKKETFFSGRMQVEDSE